MCGWRDANKTIIEKERKVSPRNVNVKETMGWKKNTKIIMNHDGYRISTYSMWQEMSF